MLLAALPFARAAVLAAPEALAACLAPAWAQERQRLAADNAALRTALAANAELQAQNTALRALLHSPAPRPAALYTARLMAQTGAGLLLFCADGTPPPGAAVLDGQGRFAGRVAEARDGVLWVPPPAGEACFAGGDPALVQAAADGWQVTGLPVPAESAAGTLVTTPEGYWLGRLAADPAPDPGDGCLTAAAPLTDTAETGTRFFVAAE